VFWCDIFVCVTGTVDRVFYGVTVAVAPRAAASRRRVETPPRSASGAAVGRGSCGGGALVSRRRRRHGNGSGSCHGSSHGSCLLCSTRARRRALAMSARLRSRLRAGRVRANSRNATRRITAPPLQPSSSSQTNCVPPFLSSSSSLLSFPSLCTRAHARKYALAHAPAARPRPRASAHRPTACS
jgi:hypothetical protein